MGIKIMLLSPLILKRSLI